MEVHHCDTLLGSPQSVVCHVQNSVQYRTAPYSAGHSGGPACRAVGASINVGITSIGDGDGGESIFPHCYVGCCLSKTMHCFARDTYMHKYVQRIDVRSKSTVNGPSYRVRHPLEMRVQVDGSGALHHVVRLEMITGFSSTPSKN